MKTLLSLDEDYILKTHFVPKMKRTGPGNGMTHDFVEGNKGKVRGKNVVQIITALVSHCDENGNLSNFLTKVEFTSRDILAIAEKIKEIESFDIEDNLADDFPF